MSLDKLGRWGLSGKLLLTLASVLGFATAASIEIFFQLYHRELAAESRLAAHRTAQVVGVALQGAMAGPDPAALRDVISRLGSIEGVAAVSLLDPAFETRLSTDPAAQGHRWAEPAALCADCGIDAGTPGIGTAFMQDATGRRLLRTVIQLDAAPGSRFVVVDEDPAPLLQRARRTAALVSLGASLITLLALAGTWFALRRVVLMPIARLHVAAQGIAAGDRQGQMPATATGGDEMTALGDAFKRMAERLEANMAALRDRDAFLQGVIDAVPDGIRVIAGDYTVVAANRNFARQVGLPPREIVGRPCYAVSHGRSQPCVPTLVVCPVSELAAGEGPVKCTHLHRHGRDEFAVEVVAARLGGAAEGISHSHVVEAIREVSQEVEVSIGQRLSEIGQLATGVAHEIHNPLASVQFGLRALQDAVGQPDRSAEMEEYIALVSREIERCIEVTGRLMRLSEASSEHGTLVELGAVARGIASLLRYEAESRGIALDVEVGDKPRIIACESDIGMVLVNLVQNAFHATPAGGRILVSADVLPGGDVAIVVADTGTGIPPADLSRVFLPFWSRRADSSEGSGLGLAICKALVRKWRGDMSVTSQEGVGTTFRIDFPSPDRLLDAA